MPEIICATKTEPCFTIGCPQPNCKGRFDVTRLIEDAKGEYASFHSRFCPVCGFKASAREINANGGVIEATTERWAPALVLLRFRGRSDLNKPVYLVVETGTHCADGVQIKEYDKYYYETSTCPSNFLGCDIVEGDDGDPHGLFEWIETVLKPDDWGDIDNGDTRAERVRAVFKRHPENGAEVMFSRDRSALPAGSVIINGKRLTQGQQMTMWVAMNIFATHAKDGWLEDLSGVYYDRAMEIIRLMQKE